MKNILFPTDFSENAANALEFATDIAVRSGANLILLHALSEKKDEENAIEQMKNLEQNFKINYRNDFKHTSIIAEANLGAAVKSVEKSRNIDLIVMGTKGINNMGKVIFGSNTAKVIESAKSPVLAIPAEVPGRPVVNVAYATDYSMPEEPVVRKVVAFARLFNANLIFLHIIDKHETDAVTRGRNYINSIKKRINYQKISYHFVQSNDIIEGINDFITDNNIDVLAMATHHKNSFEKLIHESVTKTVLNEMMVPLLVQHKKANHQLVEN